MKTVRYGFLLVGLVLVGCAHQTMRGSVAMKVAEDSAHVCLGENEVKVGDKVALFNNQCSPPIDANRVGGRRANLCTKVKAGEGIVTDVLNEHYSEVKFNKEAKFQEGSVVEKVN